MLWSVTRKFTLQRLTMGHSRWSFMGHAERIRKKVLDYKSLTSAIRFFIQEI